jgi:C1A family cysteine protease
VGTGRQNKEFMGFSAKHNKHYATVEELNRREMIF